MTRFLSDVPSSVYRLQFNKNFSLKNASQLIPYLVDLGIDGIYGSPIFVSGSSGYDITDPVHVNPILGTLEDFENFCFLMKNNGIKYILDIVPNHMGIKKNPWWDDLLERGIFSSYAEFFDIDWSPEKPQLHGKILLPLLQDFYGRVLHEGLIQLIWNEGFFVVTHDHQFPISLCTYAYILEIALENETLSSDESKDWMECLDIVQCIKKLSLEDSHEKGDLAKRRLINLYKRSPFIQNKIEKLLIFFNGKKGNPDSFNFLHTLLEKQFYRLSYWAVANQEINYRRFFNINELAAIHIEKKSVLEKHHRWIFNLVESKKVQGLRIDHPDGLYDPATYFERIQERGPAFVIIEKILDFQEKLPASWKVQGTVGYDFLNVLNGLFVEKKNKKKISLIYEKFIGSHLDFESLLYERKKWFITSQMASEINALGWRLDQLSEGSKAYRDFTRIDLTRALKEIVACFPVYRTYISPLRQSLKKDRDYIRLAIEKAKIKMPDIDASLYSYIQDLLLADLEEVHDENLGFMDFVLRFQQITAPVMAKGLEDSCFYIYNRLISLNEVGGNPQNFGISKMEFHDFNKEKLEKWPLGFLASSTHDTKCSEDVRFRINVLSEMPDRWGHIVNEWRAANRQYKKMWRHTLMIDDNTEYYLYQMLLGLWPIERDRFWSCMHKAIREAGVYTSWRWPNEEYELLVKEFISAIFHHINPDEDQIFHDEYSNTMKDQSNTFFPSFLAFSKEISRYGKWSSLSALILKMGSCGIVDIYQGNEWENLCMMDPDNRRPVDYEVRKSGWESLQQESAMNMADLFSQEAFGSLKLQLTSICLKYRNSHKELFLTGDYIPLKIQGDYQNEAIAFLRSFKNKHVLIIASRFFSHFPTPPLGRAWKDTKVILPKKVGSLAENREWHDLLTSRTFSLQKSEKHYHIFLSDILGDLPFIFSETKS